MQLPILYLETKALLKIAHPAAHVNTHLQAFTSIATARIDRSTAEMQFEIYF